MAWLIALIALPLVCLWLILFWIPHCDKKGIEKARQREQREREDAI